MSKKLIGVLCAVLLLTTSCQVDSSAKNKISANKSEISGYISSGIKRGDNKPFDFIVNGKAVTLPCKVNQLDKSFKVGDEPAMKDPYDEEANYYILSYDDKNIGYVILSDEIENNDVQNTEIKGLVLKYGVEEEKNIKWTKKPPTLDFYGVHFNDNKEKVREILGTPNEDGVMASKNFLSFGDIKQFGVSFVFADDQITDFRVKAR